MTEPRDDDSIDRLLRQTLRRTSDAGTTRLCLDAETMAAWMDGGLSGAALAEAEEHVAACPRCRGLFAALARSETAEQQPVKVLSSATPGPRARNWLPWLVPLAAAALIAMAIWLPRPAQQPAPESTVALAPPVESSSQVPATGPIAERQRSRAQQDLASAAAKEIAGRAREENGRADQAALKREAAASPAEPAGGAARPSSPPSPSLSSSAAASPAPPPPPSAAPVIAPEQIAPPATNPGPPRATFRTALETVIAEFQSPDQLAQTGATGGIAGRGAGPGGGGTAATGPAGGGVGNTAPAARGGGGGGGGGGRGGAGRGGVPGSTAADQTASGNQSQPVRWRVLASGAVERSNLPGGPWEAVAIDPPGTRVTNGAAPNPLVCWLVGPNGVVFLTTDGRSFSRVPIPEAVDLVSVRASSARAATVTTTDGRTFVTTDGGLNWSR